MDYQTADSKLTGRCQWQRKIGNNTWLIRDADAIHVKLHNTDIITFFSDGRVKLNSGGRRTSTTKNRINEFMSTGWYLQQKNFDWFLQRYDGAKPRAEFEDGIVIYPDGSITLA